jgi:hypothetical protein
VRTISILFKFRHFLCNKPIELYDQMSFDLCIKMGSINFYMLVPNQGSSYSLAYMSFLWREHAQTGVGVAIYRSVAICLFPVDCKSFLARAVTNLVTSTSCLWIHCQKVSLASSAYVRAAHLHVRGSIKWINIRRGSL